MPHRDFILMPADLIEVAPGGAEITIDRDSTGYERTCHICRKVTVRREPGPEGGKETVRRPHAVMRMSVNVVIPGLSPFELNLPVDVCGVCLPFIVAPFFPALVEQVDLSRIPTEMLHALGLSIVGKVGDVGDVEHQGAVLVDELGDTVATLGDSNLGAAEQLAEQLQRAGFADEAAAPNSPAAPSSSTSTTAAAAELVDEPPAELAEV